MIGISPQEFLLIAIVALIVIGPRELPGTLRAIGRFFATAQRAAHEARRQLDRMMREAELDEVHRDIERAGTRRTERRAPPIEPRAGAAPSAGANGHDEAGPMPSRNRM